MIQGMVSRSVTAVYERVIRPRLFHRMSAQSAHELIVERLRWADQQSWVQSLVHAANRLMLVEEQTTIGHTVLENSLILAAGFVKGDGFATEQEAFKAVHSGQNIMPGWRTMPAMVGLVEFGSYTRYPRLGNSGTVMWRNEQTHSTQNRIGLKNPGAAAAGEFLALHHEELPSQFGVNIAVSPGVTDKMQELDDVLEAVDAFVSRNIHPTWFTLNLSCPNTEDDPAGHQTHEKAEYLCTHLKSHLGSIPLWVKIGPDLSAKQYCALMAALATAGVEAVIATNTLGHPAPDGSGHIAGLGGAAIHEVALQAVHILSDERAKHGYSVAIIGCGGILTGTAKRRFANNKVEAFQYWSALVYRGPFAAAIIQFEERKFSH